MHCLWQIVTRTHIAAFCQGNWLVLWLVAVFYKLSRSLTLHTTRSWITLLIVSDHKSRWWQHNRVSNFIKASYNFSLQLFVSIREVTAFIFSPSDWCLLLHCWRPPDVGNPFHRLKVSITKFSEATRLILVDLGTWLPQNFVYRAEGFEISCLIFVSNPKIWLYLMHVSVLCSYVHRQRLELQFNYGSERLSTDRYTTERFILEEKNNNLKAD